MTETQKKLEKMNMASEETVQNDYKLLCFVTYSINVCVRACVCLCLSVIAIKCMCNYVIQLSTIGCFLFSLYLSIWLGQLLVH